MNQELEWPYAALGSPLVAEHGVFLDLRRNVTFAYLLSLRELWYKCLYVFEA